MATILNSAMLNFAFLYSAFLVFPLKLTHTCHDWLPPFAQKKLHSFILIKLDDGSHLEFCHVGFRHCHLGFRHLVIFSQIDSKHSHSTLNLTQSNSVWLIWWCQPSWILPSCIQPFSTKLWLKLIQSDSNSFILTQLDDGSHLEFYHLGFSRFAQINFTHSFWLNLMMAAILNSAMLDSATAILDSDTLLSSLRLTQNTLTLLWIWLKLIQSD